VIESGPDGPIIEAVVGSAFADAFRLEVGDVVTFTQLDVGDVFEFRACLKKRKQFLHRAKRLE
jgi:hypothetical protein